MLSKHVLATEVHHFHVEGIFVTNLGVKHMDCHFLALVLSILKKYYSGLGRHYGA
jgi:hypothetical protein